MHFSVNASKATQAVARLIQSSGGPIDYLRMSKLIYLADRKSIQNRGIPIVGGEYYSMPKGPVISEVMNFVTQRNAPNWRHTISPRQGHEIRLVTANPQTDLLSQSELEILDSTVAEHRQKTSLELVQWCHLNCPEYKEVDAGRLPIEVEEILSAANKSRRAINKIVEEANSMAEFDKLLESSAC